MGKEHDIVKATLKFDLRMPAQVLLASHLLRVNLSGCLAHLPQDAGRLVHARASLATICYGLGGPQVPFFHACNRESDVEAWPKELMCDWVHGRNGAHAGTVLNSDWHATHKWSAGTVCREGAGLSPNLPTVFTLLQLQRTAGKGSARVADVGLCVRGSNSPPRRP